MYTFPAHLAGTGPPPHPPPAPACSLLEGNTQEFTAGWLALSSGPVHLGFSTVNRVLNAGLCVRGSEEGRICVKRFRKTSPSPKPPDTTGVRDRPTGVPSGKILAPRALSPSPVFPWRPRQWRGRGASSPNLAAFPAGQSSRVRPYFLEGIACHSLPQYGVTPAPPAHNKKSLLKSQWLSLQTCCVCQELYRQSRTRWAEGLG